MGFLVAAASNGKTVNRQGLAEFFGVSLPTVDTWVRSKMPYLQRGGKGKEWQFDTAAVVDWKLAQAANEAGKKLESLTAIEKETARVKLEQEKLKYARSAALVVPLDQMERRLSIVFSEIRSSIRNVPGRVVSSIIGESDETRIKNILLDEIDRALLSLSDFDTTILDESIDNGIEKPQ